MVVFHVSTFILQLHLAGGFDFSESRIRGGAAGDRAISCFVKVENRSSLC